MQHTIMSNSTFKYTFLKQSDLFNLVHTKNRLYYNWNISLFCQGKHSHNTHIQE